MKILMIFGTRPEAIKMCPLALKLTENKELDVKICVTAQHRHMLDQVLQIFNLKPDYDLNLMKPNQTLEWLTGAIIEGVGQVISDFKPQLVLVHGDTTTSFSAALAAFYQKVDVGHVEAGLRTGDIHSPWPEEANRKLTATLTMLHFAPTDAAAQNLKNEGYSTNNIFVTGNTVIDALFKTLEFTRKNRFVPAQQLQKILPTLENKKIILITGHRRENFGTGFQNICTSLKIIAQTYPDVELVYPVHLNPHVQQPVYDTLGNLDNFHLIEPLDYQSFVLLMDLADIILTDSGGIQEEAPSLNKPVLVFREKTERPEAVNAGAVRIVGTDINRIVTEVSTLIDKPNAFGKAANPYGDGKACQRISDIIKRYYRV
ncbi:UDP-N-acetylglucosamine 2-epimerase (non-hydrolyzing) [Parashewanella spongiae]|uniref:UDP-N-acetylglucosamine 2-epimerase n=1 Tax=Parashewanella spongiae TaxID=342950 RepID=A0A3A6U084_9GAMM|nr:UDP-N-acetylglucosamine 2-epimerase (non-hydrolyzing) [Parashewanella spongiae]RJY18841.1 UDP-N-acetylglucosamine 2-epimerase (non-hydrolyzing) [Parashewanella spongiae]